MASGKTYEQDGALWLSSTDYGDDKDRVMRKSDGTYTYFGPDGLPSTSGSAASRSASTSRAARPPRHHRLAPAGRRPQTGIPGFP